MRKYFTFSSFSHWILMDFQKILMFCRVFFLNYTSSLHKKPISSKKHKPITPFALAAHRCIDGTYLLFLASPLLHARPLAFAAYRCNEKQKMYSSSIYNRSGLIIVPRAPLLWERQRRFSQSSFFLGAAAPPLLEQLFPGSGGAAALRAVGFPVL